MEIELEIEKLSSDGCGIGHYNGIVVFVDKTCPKDKVKAKVTKQNKSFYKAELIEIIEKSPYRIKPFCPMHNVCGACNLQFIDYEKQLVLKREIVKDSLREFNIDIEETVPSPETKGFRHKIQYPIRQTQVSKRILAGYFKPKSHDIVNIKYCPIQPSICDEMIEYIRETAPLYKIEGYDENKHKGLLRHVVIRSSSTNNQNLVVLVINHTKIPERLKDFAQKIYDKFDAVAGVVVNFNDKKTNLIMSDKTVCLYGQDFIKDRVCNVEFKIGANTFFQVNPKSAENIFKFVKNYIKDSFENPTVLDAYAGISAFGFVVSDVSLKVVSVEENKNSVDLAKEVKKLNNIKNIELNCEDSELFFQNEVENNKKYEVIILDPPRKGCTKSTLDYALKLSNSIIYVSCNPATLARDLKYLTEHGVKIKRVKPFDMFCHTNHIETVVLLEIF